MKKLLLLPLLFAMAVSAQADSFTFSAINGGAATGSTKLNLDNLALGHVTQMVNSDVQVSFTGTANVVMGASVGVYAAPYISGGNGAGFGNANGADTTKYLSTGIGAVTLTFSSNQNYFGILWGSVDYYNTLSFYNGANLVGSFTGTDIWASANGNQGAAGTFYVNFSDLSGAFNKVVASSTQNAFELDNLAYNRVPESGATIGLLGVAFAGLVALRRKLSRR